MKIRTLLTLSVCLAGLALPAAAQSSFGEQIRAVKKGRKLSPAMQEKIKHRLAAVKARSAEEEAPGPIGPIIERAPVEWTIESKDCSLLKSQLKGTGFLKDTVYILMNEDGTFHIDDRQEASGTAVDAAGNKYMWLYNSLGDVDTADPTPGALPVTIVGPDTFQLIPATTAGTSYLMAQYFNLTITEAGEVLPNFLNAPIACDPL